MLTFRGSGLRGRRGFHEQQGICRDEAVLALISHDMDEIIRAVKNLHLLTALERRADLQRGYRAVQIDVAVLFAASDLAKLLRVTDRRRQK